ncbi:hypothetical protein SALBM311S_11663 [Streptomyces alboniger]
MIRLSGDHVVLARKGREREFSRDAVAAVFRDGKQLVLLGHDGGELARQECDLSAGRVVDAFTRHGYAWVAPTRTRMRSGAGSRALRPAGGCERSPQGPPGVVGEEGARR